jgi:biotin carboxyl carrier protein
MGKYRIILDGKAYEIEVEPIIEEPEQSKTSQKDVRTSWNAASIKGRSPVVQIIDPAAEKPVSIKDRLVTSPMPGTVLRIMASAGETVKKDQPVLVLEAMKMENEIVATRSGMIVEMLVKEGQTVAGNEALFEIGE